MAIFAKDIGIDLGTRIRWACRVRESLREPSVVAIDKATNKVLAVGNAAKT